ncbi:hypothetical protein [Zoogloea sp.]|jgi:hypothetical protein|uniref:hypothetical protein n=1 Tax=Zoogloea sp. TaxID=49181 RepID=UPI0037D9FB14
MTKNTAEKGEEARQLLLELSSLLKEHRESNWTRGIEAAISELTFGDGTFNKAGLEAAKSIYKTMNEGGRGFAEYFFWLDSEDDRIAANKDLDNLRTRLWDVFELL